MTVRIPIAADPQPVISAFNEIKAALAAAGQQGRAFADLDLSHPELADMADELRVVQRNYEELARVGRGSTAAAVRAGGYRDVIDFAERGGREYADPNERARFVRNAGNYALQGTRFASPPAVRGGSGVGEEVAAGEGGAMGSAASKGMGMLKGIGVAALGIAGIGGLLGELHKGVGYAQEEAIGVDNLTRQVNLAASEFTGFRDGLRKASDGLMVSYNEMQKYATAFATAAVRAGAGSVTSGTATAVGLARSFGMDPGATTAMMGQLQFRGAVGSNEAQQKRFAALIAEAAVQGGVTGNVGQLISGMLSFVNASERTMTRSPDMASYLSLMTAMNASGQPGLMGDQGASIISNMNTAVTHGGNFGAASQNFMWQALNRGRAGLGVFGTEALESGGMFASEASMYKTLRGDGLSSKYLRSHGFNPNDPTTNVSRINELLKARYSDPFMRADAMHNLYGISFQQALAMGNLHGAGLNGITRILQHSGVDMTHMSTMGLEELGHIAGAGNDMSKLSALRSQFLKDMPLSAAQKHALTSASTPGALQAELTRVAASGRGMDIGSQTLTSIKGMENALTKVGAELLVPINAIRSDVAKLAGDSAGLLGDTVKATSGDKAAQKRLGGFASEVFLHPQNWQEGILSGGLGLIMRAVLNTPASTLAPPGLHPGAFSLTPNQSTEIHLTHTHVHTDSRGNPLQNQPKTKTEVSLPSPAGS